MNAVPTEPRLIPREEHAISRRGISSQAIKVLYRLHRSGFKAYLCGGGVRDLLLGGHPKDFDVVTDARPQQIRRIFRNSRTIGRRFRLVHVFFHDGIVEVSTFRAPPDRELQQADEEHLVTDDNQFGLPVDDAFRRDFTINALFYDIADFSLIDWTGGLEDLDRKIIRVIGDPTVRLREDPVRMLRACEFAGRLDFDIEQETQDAIHRERKELEKASPARLLEEIIQLMRCGWSTQAMEWMLELGLLEFLAPEAYAFVDAGDPKLEEFANVLPTVDLMIRQGRQISSETLLAVLILPKVLLRRLDVEALDQRPMSRSALAHVIDEAVEGFSRRFGVSGARSLALAQILLGFHRLLDRKIDNSALRRIVRAPHFEDALVLLEVLAIATGEGLDGVEEWKERASHFPPARPAPKAKRRRVSRPGRRPPQGRHRH